MDIALKPVFGVCQGQYVYGQVTAQNGRSTTLRTPAGETKVLTSKLDEVDPIVCLLLHDAQLSSRSVTRHKMRANHAVILDRVLGADDVDATRDIGEILDGIIPASAVDGDAFCSWIDPASQEVRSFSLRHAVDFTHFVDGDRVIPRSPRDKIGPTFIDEPAGPVPEVPSASASGTSHATKRTVTTAPADSNPALDALLAAFERDGVDATTEQVPLGDPVEAELVAMIAAKPHVLAFYLNQCADGSRKRPGLANIDADRPPKRQNTYSTTPNADLYDMDTAHDRGRSKESFQPSSTRRAIHSGLVSPKYQGKSPSTFIELAISSPATEFKPHPAVINRLYDSQFGVLGMSIAYFERFDKLAKRQWRRSRRVNMSNQSASLELPPAPPVTSLATLRDNLSVFASFAQEFFNESMQSFIKAACDFATTLTRATAWQTGDIEELTDWFDDSFEQYRHAVETWVLTGHDDRDAVRRRFSKTDPDFLLMLFSIQSDRQPRVPPLRENPRTENQRRGNEAQRDDRTSSRAAQVDKPRGAKMADEVYAALPRHNGKAVCLRYLSQRGCPSRSTDRLPDLCSAFVVTPGIVVHVHKLLEIQLRAAETKRLDHLRRVFVSAGVSPPEVLSDSSGAHSNDLNHELRRALSELVTSQNLSLKDLIRLWRDESVADSRPNKALDPKWLRILLREYPQQARVLRVAQYGVEHPFPLSHTKRLVHANHKSANRLPHALTRSLRKGQDDGTYLVLDMAATEAWRGLRFSPFGCIPKAGADPLRDARTIQNLAFPAGASTNAATVTEDLPPVSFIHICALAERIEHVRHKFPLLVIKMMKGDVKGAFRHIPLAATVAQWFGGSLAEQSTAVVDLALPFGWTGSPAFYGIFGGAVTHLVSRESPATLDPTSTDTEKFFGYEWVDDHVMIEAEHGDRLVHGANALRLAMLAVLGPRSINEDKFSSWTTNLNVLGLEWDTTLCTVSMPEEKITKATLRADKILRAGRATKLQLSQLLGSFRHVCSCVRPAKPFYQRLVSLWRRAPPFAHITLSGPAALDIHWFRHVLMTGRLRSIPTSFFGALPEPSVHLYMDASNTGLCVLHPASREYLRVQFDAEEQGMIAHCQEKTSSNDTAFSINVREQLSAVLALLVWGPSWSNRANNQTVHIRCWVDNSSAVAWCNGLYSRNEYSQELNRIIGAVVAQFLIRVSAEHIPGSRNVLADLGSRAWEGTALAKWSNCMHSWREQTVSSRIRKIYDSKSSPFNMDPLLPHHSARTHQHGATGVRTEDHSACRSGCPKTTPTSNPFSWLHSPFTQHDSTAATAHDRHLTPFAPSSAILAGIIASDSVGDLVSTKGTNLQFTIDLLHAFAAITDFAKPHHRVLFGATVLGFFFLLRSAEYLAIDGKRHAYALQVQDVEMLDSNNRQTSRSSEAVSVRIHLRGSKTDQHGVGAKRKLNRSDKAPVCPVFAAALLLQHAKDARLQREALLCSLSRNRMLSAKLVNEALRVAAATVGESSLPLSTHSLRIGGATALFQGGADELTIKHHGRWRSNAYTRYTRLTEPHGQQLTAKMTGITQPAV